MHKIFIVEDDPVIARLVAEQLERWGYEAVCARDFAHVLEEFVAAAPQLVLLDIRLPSYSGYHWCSQIRRWQGGNCQLPPDTVLEDGVAGVKIQDQTGKLEIWLSLSDGTLLQWDHTAVWQPEETLHLWPGEGAEDGN